jgi:hypothetical protein
MATSTLGSGTVVLAGTTSGTTTVTATAVAGTTTLTLPAATDTLVGKATTDTLTNKTLTTPTISQLSSAAATALTLQSAGTTAITVDTSQNVGIGTVSPTQKLHVAGNGILPTIGTSLFFFNTQFGIGTPDSAGLQIFYSDADNLNIGTRTSGGVFSEKARIDSSGNLLLNTTSTLGTTWFNVYGATSSKNGIGIQNSSDTGTIYSLFIRNASNTTIGSINNNGSTTSFTTTSDYRLKENVQPMTGALATVAQLKPCTYSWKSTGEAGQGFIAHELAEVVPDAVTGEKDGVDEENNPKYQGIDTSFLVATLTAAIQEQQALIQSLTTRITALEQK